MKITLAILGSTGSIGDSLLNLISKDKNTYSIKLLSANKNYIKLFKQAKKFNVKNLIVTDKKSFEALKILTRNLSINVFNSFDSIDLVLKKKVDYTMSAITGLDGLKPTLKIIKFTKKIAIANKESIICGWNLINKNLVKNKTQFVPVDSEHFSVWFGIFSTNLKIENIYLTASGGPFLNFPISRFKKINIKQALKHPNWKMGKKITIDSATMMNKIFEVIEAKKIFKINLNRVKILIHPNSYIHSIIKFKNGVIKIIAHDTDMKIPIASTLNLRHDFNFNTKLNINKLNNLNLTEINDVRYPVVKILKMIPEQNSLFETVIVSANDCLVDKFLNKEINFIDISKNLIKFLHKKEFLKYKKKYPKKIDDILNLSNYVRFKINSKGI